MRECLGKHSCMSQAYVQAYVDGTLIYFNKRIAPNIF